MTNATAIMARSITRDSSKLSYLITKVLVDKALRDDCFRAYAYFRWADDQIDAVAKTSQERMSFIQRQKALVDALYGNENPNDLLPEETMLADLVNHDRRPNSGLQSFIRNFMAVLEFDAARKGLLITQAELSWYSEVLGIAVTDAIQYFIGSEHAYPAAPNRYKAATAAHITHMLRDLAEDLDEGFINVPGEWLIANGLASSLDGLKKLNVDDPSFKKWVRGQSELARSYFEEGQAYLRELDVLRCKIAGFWYCARFECVLDAVERDGFLLRTGYKERRRKSVWLRMGMQTLSLTADHIMKKIGASVRRRWMKQAQSLEPADRKADTYSYVSADMDYPNNPKLADSL